MYYIYIYMSLDYKQKYLKYKKKYLELKEQMGGKIVFRDHVMVQGDKVYNMAYGRNSTIIEQELKNAIEKYPNYNKFLTNDELKFLMHILYGGKFQSNNKNYWRAIYESCRSANNAPPELCSNDLEEAKRIIKKVEAVAKNHVKKGQRIPMPIYGIGDWNPFIPAKVVEIYVDKSKIPKPKKKSFMKKLSSFTKSKKEKEEEKKHLEELAKKATKDATMYRVEVKGTHYWFDADTGKEVSEQFDYDDETHPLHELHKTPGEYYNNETIKEPEPVDPKTVKVGDTVYVPYTEDWGDAYHHMFMSKARSNGPNDLFLTFYPQSYSGLLNGFHQQLAQFLKSDLTPIKKKGEGEAPQAPQVTSNMDLPPVAQKS